MRLIFARHAESEGNAQNLLQGHMDFSLSAQGKLQAESLFTHFRSKGPQPTHIYSSPLKRAAETAQIVSRIWPLKITYSDDLKEFDVGVFSGLTWEEADKAYPKMYRAFEISKDWSVVQGAESFVEQHSRAKRVIQHLIKTHCKDDVVIVFTHGSFLLHLVSVLLGTKRLWTTSLTNTALFDFTFDQDKWDMKDSNLNNSAIWHINKFGDASHLVN